MLPSCTRGSGSFGFFSAAVLNACTRAWSSGAAFAASRRAPWRRAAARRGPPPGSGPGLLAAEHPADDEAEQGPGDGENDRFRFHWAGVGSIIGSGAIGSGAGRAGCWRAPDTRDPGTRGPRLRATATRSEYQRPSQPVHQARARSGSAFNRPVPCAAGAAQDLFARCAGRGQLADVRSAYGSSVLAASQVGRVPSFRMAAPSRRTPR